MQLDPKHDFTDREKFLLSYYRDKQLSNSSRAWLYDIVTAAVSLSLFFMFLSNGEVPLAFVAYALVLGRLFYIVAEGGKWTRDLQNIIAKFDGRIAELNETLNRKEGEK